MNYELLHQITFYAMYGVMGIALLVIIERLIFDVVTLRHAKQLEAVMTHNVHSLGDLPERLVTRSSVGALALREMLETKSQLTDARDIEDLSEAIYIAMK